MLYVLVTSVYKTDINDTNDLLNIVTIWKDNYEIQIIYGDEYHLYFQGGMRQKRGDSDYVSTYLFARPCFTSDEVIITHLVSE